MNDSWKNAICLLTAAGIGDRELLTAEIRRIMLEKAVPGDILDAVSQAGYNTDAHSVESARDRLVDALRTTPDIAADVMMDVIESSAGVIAALAYSGSIMASPDGPTVSELATVIALSDAL